MSALSARLSIWTAYYLFGLKPKKIQHQYLLPFVHELDGDGDDSDDDDDDDPDPSVLPAITITEPSNTNATISPSTPSAVANAIAGHVGTSNTDGDAVGVISGTVTADDGHGNFTVTNGSIGVISKGDDAAVVTIPAGTFATVTTDHVPDTNFPVISINITDPGIHT